MLNKIAKFLHHFLQLRHRNPPRKSAAFCRYISNISDKLMRVVESYTILTSINIKYSEEVSTNAYRVVSKDPHQQVSVGDNLFKFLFCKQRIDS